MYDVLSNRRRRFAIHYLKSRGETTSLGELSEQVAAWENGCEVEEVTHAQRKRVYTALQQSHLPVMDDAGVVIFDKDRGIVEPTDSLESVDIYLDLVRDADVPWSEYYLGLSTVCAVVVAVAWLDLSPLSTVPDLGWAVFMVVAFGVSALAHEYATRSSEIGASERPPELGGQ